MSDATIYLWTFITLDTFAILALAWRTDRFAKIIKEQQEHLERMERRR